MASYQCETSWDYSLDVYLWKLSQQAKFRVYYPLYAQNSPVVYPCGVTPLMRQVVLKWIIEINRQFKFSLDTICVTANILDRFLSIRPVHKDCLQLAALTAFFIAAKAEEVDPPELCELVSLCMRSYDSRQFRWMEYHVLSNLNFELLCPTPAFFLHHLIEVEQMTQVWPYQFTQHLVERCLCDFALANVLPAHLAHAVFAVIVEQSMAGDHRIVHFKKPVALPELELSREYEELTSEYVKRVILTIRNEQMKFDRF